MISIVDYGMGNLRSVEKSFTSQGIDVRVTADPGDIESSSGVVLPGVGAFGDCVRNLRERSMTGPIKDFIGSGRPFLGICLGFQVLFESSEEAPGERGLEVFRGKVVRFRPEEKKMKVPHMGWNRVSVPAQSPILEGVPQRSWFYSFTPTTWSRKSRGSKFWFPITEASSRRGSYRGTSPLFSST